MSKILFQVTPEDSFFKKIEELLDQKLEKYFDKSRKNEDPFLTRKQTAALLKVTPQTLYNWERQGKIKSVRIANSKAIRYRFSDVKKIMSERDFGL